MVQRLASFVTQEKSNFLSNANNVDFNQICGCKGIRYCKSCLNTDRVISLKAKNNEHLKYNDYDYYYYNLKLQKAIYSSSLNYNSTLDDVRVALSTSNNFKKDVKEMNTFGLTLIEDFLTSNEEEILIKKILCLPWKLSQSGRRKQDYGPKVNFKKKKINVESFLGIPDYVDIFLNRLEQILNKNNNEKDNFNLFEMCNLEYVAHRNSSIEMHKDDDWIWGNRLISINLENDTIMSFEDTVLKKILYVYLPKKSLLCISDVYRNVYLHGIFSHHIVDRRISITLREASSLFKEGGDLYKKYGKLIKVRANMRIMT